MLYQVIKDGKIAESYGMPDHDDTHHLTTKGDRKAIHSVGSDTTLEAGHYTVLVNASVAARTITLPLAANHKGRVYNIKKIDSSVNDVIINASGTDEIDDVSTKTISFQYESYKIQSDGTNWWVL